MTGAIAEAGGCTEKEDFSVLGTQEQPQEELVIEAEERSKSPCPFCCPQRAFMPSIN